MAKKIILVVMILIVASLSSILVIINLDNKNNEGNGEEKNLVMVLEVGSNITKQDLLGSNLKVIDDETIDTSTLKEDEITIYYYEGENKKNKTVKYEIKDITPPVVILNSTYSVTKGYDKVLSDAIFCKDNYDNKPKCEIIGNYNLNELGEYQLSFIATDSSNNKTEVPFTLKVIEESKNTSSTSTNFSDVYKEHKNENTEIGIDVSKWQGNINFNKVKSAGASFVMIRLGYQDGYNGELKIDPYFKKNIESATSLGLKVGVYFFSYAKTSNDAKEQVKFITDNLKGYEISLPIVLDWENWNSFNSLDMNIIDLNKMASTFLDEINNSGYKSMIYGSKNYLDKVWIDKNKKTTWLAHYTAKTTYDKPYLMWQLCSNGKIDGINGYVDIDIMYNN